MSNSEGAHFFFSSALISKEDMERWAQLIFSLTQSDVREGFTEIIEDLLPDVDDLVYAGELYGDVDVLMDEPQIKAIMNDRTKQWVYGAGFFTREPHMQDTITTSFIPTGAVPTRAAYTSFLKRYEDKIDATDYVGRTRGEDILAPRKIQFQPAKVIHWDAYLRELCYDALIDQLILEGDIKALESFFDDGLCVPRLPRLYSRNYDVPRDTMNAVMILLLKYRLK